MQARQTADANGLALAVRMQLQQLATKLDARRPPSVPAVSPAVLANGPEPRLGTPERIAGDGSQQPPCAPLAVTSHRPTRLATGCGSSPGTCHFWWSPGSCSQGLRVLFPSGGSSAGRWWGFSSRGPWGFIPPSTCPGWNRSIRALWLVLSCLLHSQSSLKSWRKRQCLTADYLCKWTLAQLK